MIAEEIEHKITNLKQLPIKGTRFVPVSANDLPAILAFDDQEYFGNMILLWITRPRI